ncbi:hypothetical protein UT300012_23430 [Paraclostridium bifermentans]
MEKMRLQNEKRVPDRKVLEKVKTSYNAFFSKILDTTTEEFKSNLPYDELAPRLIQFEEFNIGNRRGDGLAGEITDEEILTRFDEGMMLKTLSQDDNMVKAMIPPSLREGKILYEYTKCPSFPKVVMFNPVTLDVALNMIKQGKKVSIVDFRLLCMMNEPSINQLVRIEEFLDTESFSKAQIKQIEQGINEGLGLKVYIYAKKYFNEEQMSMIRATLVEGLEARWLADSELSANRMLIIQQALRLKVPVVLLRNRSIRDKQAQAIFEGLVAGISEDELSSKTIKRLSAKEIESYVDGACK